MNMIEGLRLRAIVKSSTMFLEKVVKIAVFLVFLPFRLSEPPGRNTRWGDREKRWIWGCGGDCLREVALSCAGRAEQQDTLGQFKGP